MLAFRYTIELTSHTFLTIWSSPSRETITVIRTCCVGAFSTIASIINITFVNVWNISWRCLFWTELYRSLTFYSTFSSRIRNIWLKYFCYELKTAKILFVSSQISIQKVKWCTSYTNLCRSFVRCILRNNRIHMTPPS